MSRILRFAVPRLVSVLVLGLVALPTVSEAQQAVKSFSQTAPLDRKNLDTTCAPCANFYQFANGGWIAKNPIPPAYSQWGSFNEVRDNNLTALRNVLEEAAAARRTSSDPTTRKLGMFYASCMDSATIERQGATPLAAPLREIAAIRSADGVRKYVIRQHARGQNVVFFFGATQDAKNSAEVITAIQQGGIGLPDRDYYLNPDAKSVATREAYLTHVVNDLVLAGTPRTQAEADARNIVALETELAKASLTRVQRRDPKLTYNRKTPAELAALTKGFDWTAYFKAHRLPNVVAIDVQNPKFVTVADSLMTDVAPDVWRAYFRWHLVRDAAPTLGSAFVNEDFAFQRVLMGAKEQLPRYKRCITATDHAMGDALGKAYVARYFTPDAKKRALAMVQNLKSALRERLSTRTWMSDSTRAQAYAKLDSFTDKIGYPDKWMDYSSLAVTPANSYYKNVVATVDFLNVDDLKRVGRPVDRARWVMTAPAVNAYYNPPLNEIVFPAGILQRPFFDPNADDAVNYGGIGAVIGHEMTHGFDDTGSQYDAQGNLRQWFTDADLAKFKGLTKVVSEQFDGYTILDSLHVNGKLTLGENIADLGGLTVAYVALQKALEGKPRTTIDGFTPEQRFFLAWAQVWRNNITPELARLRVNTDSHSPQIWRTNGPLSNMPEFAKAWGCAPSDPMVRPADKQADIW
jgi:putative endopeptidase